MKVLIWTNKYGDELFDASTKELELAAYLEVFRMMDGDDYYIDIAEPEPMEVCEPCTKSLHRLCEGGEECSCEEGECQRKRVRHFQIQSMQELYKKAKAGDAKAAKEFVDVRSHDGYEYERVNLRDVNKPRVKKARK